MKKILLIILLYSFRCSACVCDGMFHARIEDKECSFHTPGKSNFQDETEIKLDMEDIQFEKEDDELLDVESSFGLAPNPTSNTSVIQVETRELVHSYKVINSQGRIIESGDFSGLSKSITLPKGIYMIQVKINDLWQSKRLVVI